MPDYTVDLPELNYTALEWESAIDALEKLIQYRDSLSDVSFWNDFLETNIGMVVMHMMAWAAKTFGFVSTQTSREMFFNTCQRYQSALHHAKMLGYSVGLPAASSVIVEPQNYTSLPAAATLSVRQGDILRSGDLYFESQSLQLYTWVAAPSTPDIQITLSEGRTRSDSFRALGYAVVSEAVHNQQFKTSLGNVINDSWTVTVNGEEWTEVDALIYTADTKSYATTIDDTGAIYVTFGNGLNGQLLPSGAEVGIAYRVGGGRAGNVVSGSINEKLPCLLNAVSYQLKVTNTSNGGGGENRESLEHIKEYAPLWVTTTNRAITPIDYNVIAGSFRDESEGAIAEAVSSLKHDDLSYLGTELNYVDTWAWSRDIDGKYVAAPLALRNVLLAHLDDPEIGMICIENTIYPGEFFLLDVNLGTVKVDPSADLTEVETAIDAAFDAYFNALRAGQTIKIKELYALVNAITEVTQFVIQAPVVDQGVAEYEIGYLNSLAYTLEYDVG